MHSCRSYFTLLKKEKPVNEYGCPRLLKHELKTCTLYASAPTTIVDDSAVPRELRPSFCKGEKYFGPIIGDNQYFCLSLKIR